MSPRTRIRADRRVGLLLGGVVLLVFVALGVTVALPASDPDVRAEGENVRVYGEQEREGMRIFAAEGCWYCHTQQVRDTPADAGFGEPLEAADYAADRPAMLGFERFGPDLTHVGTRYDSATELARLLTDPEGAGLHPAHPVYDFLSEEDLLALAAYLLALR